MYNCAWMDAGLLLCPRTKKLSSAGKSQAGLGCEKQWLRARLPCREIAGNYGPSARFQGWAEMLFIVHENQISRAGRLDARDACQLHSFVSQHAGLHKLSDLFDRSP